MTAAFILLSPDGVHKHGGNSLGIRGEICRRLLISTLGGGGQLTLCFRTSLTKKPYPCKTARANEKSYGLLKQRRQQEVAQ